jgi:hypothetical protein
MYAQREEYITETQQACKKFYDALYAGITVLVALLSIIVGFIFPHSPEVDLSIGFVLAAISTSFVFYIRYLVHLHCDWKASEFRLRNTD